MIGVAGNRARMPQAYPLGLTENAGNMIHARAPLRILADTVDYHTDRWKSSGAASFADFVNKHCSHLVITMANSVWVNTDSGRERYRKFTKMLELYDVPIVIFGLGVRSPTQDLSEATLVPEAVEMLQYMQQRCGTIGVRGPFTQKVFAELAGVTDVVVTGCPSFYSEPRAFKRLRNNLKKGKPGVHAYAGTNYQRPSDLSQFGRTVRNGGYYIETTLVDNHKAHLQALRGETVDVPKVLKPALIEQEQRSWIPGRRAADDPARFTREQLTEFYRSRYRLFRDPDDWLRFNAETISHTFGTRFHVNMASLLAGVPATWVTHDSRTRELCDVLHLPQVDLEAARDMAPEDFRAAAQFDDMFDALPGLFDSWAEYLNGHGLAYDPPANLI